MNLGRKTYCIETDELNCQVWDQLDKRVSDGVWNQVDVRITGAILDIMDLICDNLIREIRNECR